MRNGFTFVELVIVISIIGVISAMAMGSYSGVSARARDARRKDDLKKITTALNEYYLVNSRYPAAGAACDYGDTCYVTSLDGDDWIPELVPDYIDALPVDPINNATARSDDYNYGGGGPAPTNSPPTSTPGAGGIPTPTPTSTIGGIPTPTPTSVFGGQPTPTPTIPIVIGGDDEIPTPTDGKPEEQTFNPFDTLFAAYAAVVPAPWHVSSAYYIYSYGNVSGDGQSYDLSTRLESKSDPDRCEFKGYQLGINNNQTCVTNGGIYTDRLYDVSPRNKSAN
ncbi:MAG: prepilin-type N-terminal cleavage/methylation domain-containing protein [Weeksellaceae bacterium]